MSYFVYILASAPYGTLYIGITNNFARLEQHRKGRGSEFARKYRVHRLVHVEHFKPPSRQSPREKQPKKWKRDWKIRLIETDNLAWRDLFGLI